MPSVCHLTAISHTIGELQLHVRGPSERRRVSNVEEVVRAVEEKTTLRVVSGELWRAGDPFKKQARIIIMISFDASDFFFTGVVRNLKSNPLPLLRSRTGPQSLGSCKIHLQ
jgi:hypothetical protein